MFVTITDDIRRKVNETFADLVGQGLAINMLKRKLATALAQTPPTLGETILLAGPPSTGKTTLASRMASVLQFPFVEIDGKTIKTREQMFAMLETAALASDMSFTRQGQDKGGLPVYAVPPIMMFIDEAQQVSEDLQNALLAALEPAVATSPGLDLLVAMLAGAGLGGILGLLQRRVLTPAPARFALHSALGWCAGLVATLFVEQFVPTAASDGYSFAASAVGGALTGAIVGLVVGGAFPRYVRPR